MKNLFVLALIICVALSAQDLQRLQSLLNEVDATWEAGETSMTNLSSIERQKLLGVLPGRSGLFRACSVDEGIDTTEEIRGSYTVPVTSVKHQGQCGSCYSFATCAVYESNALVKNGTTYDLSEQDFMMKAKATGPYGGCDGWYLDTSMDLLKNKGVTSESNCPYVGYERRCANTGSQYKIQDYSQTTSLNGIKSALQKYGALLCMFIVYEDFFSYETGVYRYTSGEECGGHAVAIVGFDDNHPTTNGKKIGAFKVKNSWGKDWGENGYFWIAYDQMDSCVQFVTADAAYYITK
jgi:C1A family cysteine protease